MQIKIVENARTIISNPNNVHNYFGWSTIARLPDGVLATVCSGYRVRHVDPFGKCVISYSRDNGKSWSNPSILIDTPYDDRDGGITVFGDGNVIVTSFVCRPKSQVNCLEYYNNVSDSEKMNAYIKSYLDMVETPEMFKKYFGSTFVISRDGGYTFSELRHAPVTNPHGPLAMPDGSLLFVGNKMPEYEKICSGEKEPMCCYKYTEEGGFNYLSTINLPENAHSCEPYAFLCKEGKIIVHIRVDKEKAITIFQCESYDGGLTFTEPHQLLNDDGGGPSHIIRHSSGILISTYGYREDPQGIRAMFSKDEGETWDTDYILFDKGYTRDVGYPSTVELPDGKLLTVFYTHDSEDAIHTPAIIKQIIWEIEQ